jgi:hypothetical protein
MPVTSTTPQINGNVHYDRQNVTLDPFSKTSKVSESSNNVNSVDVTKRMTISNFNNFSGIQSSVSPSHQITGYMAKKVPFYSPHSGNCLRIDGTCNFTFLTV